MDANMGDFAEEHKLSRYLYICNRTEVAQARDIKWILGVGSYLPASPSQWAEYLEVSTQISYIVRNSTGGDVWKEYFVG